MNKKTYILAFVLTAIAIFQLLYLPHIIEVAKTENNMTISGDMVHTPTAMSATTALSEDGAFEYYTGTYSCKFSGVTKTGEGILDTYVVQKGDSLLSIANKIYSDTTKASDIVSLNKYKYNSLTTASSFLEVGWKLLLPEPDISLLGEGFEITSGQIYILKEGEIIIKTGPESGGMHFYVNHLTTNLPNLQLGDCVNIFAQSNSQVYKIEAQ